MNLKTEQDRKQAIEAIEQSLVQSLRDIGVELSDDAISSVHERSIEISLKATGRRKEQGFRTAFASEIIIYKEKEISYGSTGTFKAKNKEAYWRTIHAASILKNWEKVCEAVNEHCQKYSDLIQEIQKQNP